MRQMLSRRISAAFAAAFIGSFLLAGTASAGTKTSSVTNLSGCYRNTLGLCVWTSTANFAARWGASQQHSEGQTYWTFTNFEMTSVVANGKNCSIGPNACTGWTWFANVTFYNSAGAQVYKRFWSASSGPCYSQAYASTSKFFGGCATLFDVPISAVKMKIHWGVGMQCGTCGFQVPWSADRTVTITNT
jgi:hypothetical protein